MRKLHFTGEEIALMSEAEAGAWLDAYAEVIDAPSGAGKAKYVVKRDKGKGRSRQ